MFKIFFIIAALLISSVANAQSQRNPCYNTGTPGNCVPVGTNTPLPVAPTNTVAAPLVTSPTSYPTGATPVTSSATGTTGAITATLAGAASKTTYICGFFYTGTNATAANTATNLTITGTINGTLNFGFATLAAAATVPNNQPLDEAFTPCVPASAVNTSIVVNGPALGAGATLATVTAWGYQQ